MIDPVLGYDTEKFLDIRIGIPPAGSFRFFKPITEEAIQQLADYAFEQGVVWGRWGRAVKENLDD